MRASLVLAAWLAVAGMPAHAAPPAGGYDFLRPGEYVRLLQKAGYRAVLKKQDSGRPYIESAADGNDFSIFFYECDAINLNCKSFEFFGWWKKRPYFDAALANKWNNEKRFLKAAIDADGDLTVRIYGTAVGLTEAAFLELLDWYTVMNADLGRFIDDADPAARKTP